MNRKQRSPLSSDSSEEIRRDIGRGLLHSFYLVYGQEEFGRTSFVDWLLSQVVPEQAREFNLDTFRAPRFDPLDFLHIYQSYPMMAERRVLVLTECDNLNPDQCKAIEPVVDRPVDTSCVVLIGSKVDMRRRLFQQVGKRGKVAEFKPPYDDRVADWIKRQVRNMGLKIEPGAADLLCMYIGNSPRELVGEIEKIVTYLGSRKTPISPSAVEAVTAVSRQVNVFDLADAVGARKARAALSMLNRYLDQGEDSNRALAMIVRHFSLLLRIKVQIEKGISKEDIAKLVGISPFFAGNYIEQASRYSLGYLWRCMGLLRRADLQLRSMSRKQERGIMDQLMVHLCGM